MIPFISPIVLIFLLYSIAFPANTAPVAGSGNALNFDGADDYVSMGSPALFDDMTAITAEAWIYARSEGESYGRIFDKADLAVPTYGWIFSVRPSNVLRFSVGYSTTFLYAETNTGAFGYNKWHHVAATWNNSATATTVHIYIDGVEVDLNLYQNGVGTRQTDASQSLRIGSDKATSRTFDGYIDEARLWSVVRTQAQIQDNRFTHLTGSETGLAGYWCMDTTAGTVLRDFTANGNNGTLYNMTNADWVASNAWKNRTMTVAFPGDSMVICGGYDPNGDQLTLSQYAAPSKGTLSFINNPSSYQVIYKPFSNGTDQFTFQASDGSLTDTFTVSTDVTGVFFTVGSHAPEKVAQCVAANSNISVTFNTTVNGSTITENSFNVDGGMSGKIAGVYSGGGTNTITFNPNTDFKPGEVVTVTLTTAIRSVGGDALPNDYTWQFTVAGTGGGFVSSTANIISSSAGRARNVYAADIDGDGDVDVLSASLSDNKIAWYKNNGMGSFTEYTITSTAPWAFDVCAADIDGDGDMDVLSASGYDNTIAWYKNDGNENFTKYSIAIDALNASSVRAVDLDGDGDMDVLASAGNSAKVIWYENNGNQGFTSHDIATGLAMAMQAHAVDLDKDGDMDVLTASFDDDKICWYENNGSQGFTQRIISTTADGASRVYAADLDGDGDVDVLSSSANDNKIAWYKNNGSQGFTARTITAGAYRAMGVYAADMDGDGDLDILSASSADDKVAWHANNGSGSFTAFTITTSADSANSVYAADLDGDGDLDVLCASKGDNKITWYKNYPAMTITITKDPLSQQVESGSTVIFSATVEGISPISYKWFYKKSTAWTQLAVQDTSVLTLAAVDTSKSGTYRVIVSNSVGADTSSDAILSVYLRAAITKEPANDTALSGSPVQFWVNATGYPLTYRWQRVTATTSWSDIAPAVSASYTVTASAADTGSYFRCIVCAGPSTDTGLAVNFTLGSAPRLTAALVSDAVIGTGKVVSFAMSASGVPVPGFDWYCVPVATGKPIFLGSGTTWRYAATAKTDSCLHYVVATNRFGTVGDSSYLHVLNKVSLVNELPRTYSYQAGKSISLAIAAAGDGTVEYAWYCNDTAISGQTNNALLIPAADVSYSGKTVYCTARNTFKSVTIGTVTTGRCTLLVSKYCNPFTVAVSRIEPASSLRAQVKVWSDQDTSQFPNNLPLFAWSDSVWVFYKTRGYDTTGHPGSYMKGYAIKTLKSLWPNPLFDTLPVPPLTGNHDSSYWFSSSIQWHNPDTLLRPLFKLGRFSYIDSTAGIQNLLSLRAQYIERTNKAYLILKNLSTLKPATDSLIVLECSMQEGFGTILYDTAFAVTSINTAADSLVDLADSLGVLPLERDTLFYRYHVLGRNNQKSSVRSGSFMIGWERPVYGGRLKADTTGINSALRLFWDNPGTVDSIRIWWDTKAIPLVHDIQAINLPLRQAWIPAAYKTADTLGNLSPGTKYHFGLQVFKEGMWSVITSNSSASATTQKVDSNLVVLSRAIVQKYWFSDTVNAIRVLWAIDTTVIPSGTFYEYATTFSPGNSLDTARHPVCWSTITRQANQSLIDLDTALLFDADFTFGIWLHARSAGGSIGTFVYPSGDNSGTVNTGPFGMQVITLFPFGKDIVTAVNRKLLFAKKTVSFQYTDTIRRHIRQTPLPGGFVQLGAIPFRFCRPNPPVAPFTLGITFDSTLFATYRSKIVVYKDSAGALKGFDLYQVKKGVVWIDMDARTMTCPIMVLADTLRPVVTIEQYSDSIVPVSTIPTRFTLSDNASNVKWKFLYGQGNTGFVSRDSGTADSTFTIVTTMIDSAKVPVMGFGIRAYLVVYDSASIDTYNVSRSVRTPLNELFAVVAHAWAPLRSTAHLDQPSLDSVFMGSIPDWTYDIQKYRIFKYTSADNAAVNRWTEYGGGTKQLFRFAPGTVLWCKSDEAINVRFGSAVSVSLKNPFEIVLKPHDWTDISLPFQFPVMLQDILDANGKTTTDSIEVYYWNKKGDVYEAQMLYSPFVGRTPPYTDTVKSSPKHDAYTVYNYGAVQKRLSIPPLCLPLSRYPPLCDRYKATGNTKDRWTVAVRWKRESEEQECNPILMGCKPGLGTPLFYGPLPPTMNTLSAGVYDSASGIIHGYALQNSMEKGGMLFDLVFANNSDAQAQLSCFPDVLSGLPQGFSTTLLDPQTGAVVQADAEHRATVIVGPHGTEHRYAVIGDAAYMAAILDMIKPVQLGIVGMFPNPFRSMLKIQYRIPAGMAEVNVSLHDVRGRLVWKQRNTTDLIRGTHFFVFMPGHGCIYLASGTYIISLTAIDKKGNALTGGRKKITFMR